ncbi:hypothetical protein CPB86DRAFT_296400 [Serendipita vermifera]|nr:hypothetical protein CPB86DRAFT_296400 [Serendipita vermifera]
MWTLICPYFGVNDSGAQQSKLLKTGEDYSIGRRDCNINVNQAWMSRQLGRFIVGQYSEGDVFNMDKVPPLEYIGNKAFRVLRVGEDKPLEIVAGGTALLQHGDHLILNSKMRESPIRDRPLWTDIVCFVEDIQVIKPKDCAVLGIKMCVEYHPKINRYITEQITGEPNQLPILLRGGSIVKKEWAQELFRRLYLSPGLPSTGVVSLEDNCLQPALEDYLPPFSPNLKREYCQNSIWRENAHRKGMLTNLRLVFLVEGAALATVWKNIVDAGEGTYETFDIHKGVVKWMTYITQLRGKATEEGFGIVLVANEEKLHAAVGGQGWKTFIQDTLRSGLQFISHTKITEAILLVQKDLLKSEAEPTNVPSQLPEIIPNSLPNEESPVEASQERRGTTRRTRRQPTPAPAPEPVDPPPDEGPLPGDEPVPGRSRILKRRVRQPSAEPQSDSQFTTSAVPNSALSDRALSPPAQSSATIDRTKLRRRNPTQRSQAVESETQSTLERHRKHFEETDPERYFLSQSEQDGMRTRASSVGRSLVDLVEHADQERIKALETAISSRKRKAVGNDEGTRGGGQDNASENSSLGEPKEPPTKKRMLDRMEKPTLEVLPEAEEEEEPPPEVLKVKPKKKKEATVVDSDEKYLTALATWKKGRKKEDQFDREFNNLKIVKPDRLAELDVEMEAWQMMPKDMDVRGNFMVCIASVKVRRDTRPTTRKDGNSEWIGRPDFKKFKKKLPPRHNAIVDLVENMQTLGMEHSDEEESGSRLPVGRTTRPELGMISDEDESQEAEGFSGRSKPGMRSQSTRKQKEQLFIPDSDEEDVFESRNMDESDDGGTGRQKRNEGVNGKRKAVVLAVSSSEDEGYAKRRKRRR